MENEKASLKVLICDDSPDVAFSLECSVADAYEDTDIEPETESVFSPAAAYEKLEAGNFDILIIDQNLGRNKGNEVVKELRAKGNRIPVILKSGGGLSINERDLWPIVPLNDVEPQPIRTIVDALVFDDPEAIEQLGQYNRKAGELAREAYEELQKGPGTPEGCTPYYDSDREYMDAAHQEYLDRKKREEDPTERSR